MTCGPKDIKLILEEIDKIGKDVSELRDSVDKKIRDINNRVSILEKKLGDKIVEIFNRLYNICEKLEDIGMSIEDMILADRIVDK